MTKNEYFKAANQIAEWTRLGLITEAEAAERNAILENNRKLALRNEFTRLEKALKDLWEGCVPWHEAIEMIGRPGALEVVELRRRWNGWNKKLSASQCAW